MKGVEGGVGLAKPLAEREADTNAVIQNEGGSEVMSPRCGSRRRRCRIMWTVVRCYH
jgi:hypothetical protein